MTMIKRDQGEGGPPGVMAEGDGPRPTLAFKTAFRPEAVASHPAPDAEPVQVRGTRVISPETARAVRQMLQLSTGPGGTAPKAQAMGYSVGGKTGTAHKQEGRGYATNKYRSWFVGIAPISNPRIIVAVMVDEPGNGQYYGGLVAAPVFSQVVQQTLKRLGVLPDIEVQSQIISNEPGELESF